MFTLHFLEGDQKWSVAMGPNVPMKSNPKLVVVPESESTRRLQALLKSFPAEQTLVLGAVQEIVTAALGHHARSSK